MAAPSLEIISARSSGFGAPTTGQPVRNYGNFLCPAAATVWDPVSLNQIAFAPTATAITGGDDTVWFFEVTTPTTEAVRVVSVNIPVGAVPTAGLVYVSVISYSETQPPNFSPTAWRFDGARVLNAGQGPYQMAPIAVLVPVSGATTVTIPVGFDMGAGWTGRIMVHPSTGFVMNVFPIVPQVGANLNAQRQNVCFAPTVGNTATVVDATQGGISLGNIRMTLTLSNGGPLSHVSAMTGTSSAAALIAGEAALVRQYFTGGFFPSGVATPANGFTPSAALLKATLINSASPLAEKAFNAFFGAGNLRSPSTASQLLGAAGFGVPNLVRGLSFATLGGSTRASNAIPTLLLPGLSVAPGSPLTGVDPTLTIQGQTLAYCFDTVAGSPAGAGTMPLSITLVWTDPAATPAAAFALVNNLDLIVTLPNGLQVFGNSNITSLNPNPATQLLDARNNVEVVNLAAPVATLTSAGGARITGVSPYIITIRSTSLPFPPQAFSLVVTGPGVQQGTLNAAGVCATGAFPPAFPVVPGGGGGGGAPAAAAASNNDNILTISIATSAALGMGFLVAITVAIVLYYRQGTGGGSSTTSAPRPNIKSPNAWGEGGSVSTSNALRNAGNTEIELAAVSPSSKVNDWAGGAAQPAAAAAATAAKV